MNPLTHQDAKSPSEKSNSITQNHNLLEEKFINVQELSSAISLIPQNLTDKNYDEMTHKELQHFIRLKNNKSERYITNELFNWISHLVSALSFLLCTFGLGCYTSYLQQPTLMIISCIIYGLLQTTMFVSSTLHHSIGLGGFSYNVYLKLKGLDHISIFLSIAGSYLPILNIIKPKWLGILLTCVVLADAISGILVRAICGMKVKMRIYIIMYVAMGWIGLSAVYFVYEAVGWQCILLLVLMGITYTVGALCYYKKVPTIKRGVFQSHELWHVFVTVASVIHMINMFLYIAPYDDFSSDEDSEDS